MAGFRDGWVAGWLDGQKNWVDGLHTVSSLSALGRWLPRHVLFCLWTHPGLPTSLGGRHLQANVSLTGATCVLLPRTVPLPHSVILLELMPPTSPCGQSLDFKVIVMPLPDPCHLTKRPSHNCWIFILRSPTHKCIICRRTPVKCNWCISLCASVRKHHQLNGQLWDGGARQKVCTGSVVVMAAGRVKGAIENQVH